MMEVGRICTKIAGRDAGKKCVIIDVLDDRFVIIDGETRRRKCNVKHIEPSDNLIKISKKASHEEVKSEFKKLGIEIKDTKPRPKKEKKKQVRSAERKKMLAKEEKRPAKPKKEKTSEHIKTAEAENKEEKASAQETKLEKTADENK